MTMAPYEDDDIPTLRELSRILREIREDLRHQANMSVRKDVHGVEHENLNVRVTRMEAAQDQQEKQRSALRNQYYFSVVGAVLSLVVALVVAAVK
jgi:CHASE3 domain sensor protein